MSNARPQTLANHGRTDPWFHYCIVPILVVLFLHGILFLVHHFSILSLWLEVVTLVLLLAVTRARIYALKVQDRVIRLEERLRFSTLLPDLLRARIPELTEQQLIALRFASDGEVPALVARTLAENLTPKAIKLAIVVWRPDYWRV